MPIKSEPHPIFSRLLRERGMILTDSIPTDSWSPNRRDVFESIEKPKQFKYITYAFTQYVAHILSR